MKNAFEQIYGAPFLARLLFVEIGTSRPTIFFWKWNTTAPLICAQVTEATGLLPFWPRPKSRPNEMAEFLSKRFQSGKDLPATLDLALDAWTVGQLKTDEAMPGDDEIRRQRSERLGRGTISAAVLERNTNRAVRYRAVEASDLAPLIAK